MVFEKSGFIKAVPVWARGKERELNCSLWFECEITGGEDTLLRIAGANDYQVFVNGRFCHYGPARAGRGHYRVDEIEIGNLLFDTTNTVRILVGAYNVSSFCFFNEGGFLCAEIIRKNAALCATGDGSWRIYDYPEKIVKTLRYSYQRPFAEAYDFTGESLANRLTECSVGEKLFIKRKVPYPIFESAEARPTVIGGFLKKENPNYYSARFIDNAGGEMVDGFKPAELSVSGVWLADELELADGVVASEGAQLLTKGHYVRYETESELTGFVELSVSCISDAVLLVTFDEILTEDGKVDYGRLGCSNVIYYKLKGGRKYRLISSVAYALKHLELICTEGEAEAEYLGLIRLDFNPTLIKKAVCDTAPEEIKKIYSAAVNTFRQNTVDIFMDCPSRERAGWLCDSFFTARVEYLLTGKQTVEAEFLRNFAMEERYKTAIPDGMLPMCYPCEHKHGSFIPNWSMWYLLELREYLKRSGDREFVDEFKKKAYELVDYFSALENGEGLIERLKGWVFVEWSRSNDLTQDITYPSNMLYYAFLKTVAELYDDESLSEKAEKLRGVIRNRSRCGLFFSDNSVYENGVAILSGECTESCQYYAFFTGVATPREDAELWRCLVESFGPKRDTATCYPEIAPSNAFIGNYLRCELLMRYEMREKLTENIGSYFLYMAERTGTLWENDTTSASCNHGFASHVLVWLDYLGYLK